MACVIGRAQETWPWLPPSLRLLSPVTCSCSGKMLRTGMLSAHQRALMSAGGLHLFLSFVVLGVSLVCDELVRAAVCSKDADVRKNKTRACSLESNS